ncbi:hypothetical protein HK101_002974 [Irineochytrium annulatum]|nr:hypothetical protein HK101_002974 [Irineochytrium annulatum]
MIIPKLAIILFLIRLLPIVYGSGLLAIVDPLLLVSVISIFVGSIGLGYQYRIKRFLVYSSISNIGYILITLLIHTDLCFLYLLIYTLTLIGIFTILLSLPTMVLATSDSMDELLGLVMNNLPLAMYLGLATYSLIGLPPLAGFYTKLLVLEGLLLLDHTYVLILIVLLSTIGAANYYRMIQTSQYKLAPNRDS